MSTDTVQIVLAAQDRASQVVTALQGRLGILGKSVGALGVQLPQTGTKAAGFTSNISGMLGPMALATGAGVALAEGAKQVGEFLGQAAAASAKEKVEIAKLGAALHANVPYWNDNTAAIEEAIKKREDLAFSDDDLRDSLAQLVMVTHDVNSAMRGQSVAMDLARAKGMSLHDASVLVGKVMGGNVGILKRYGIAIGDIKDPVEALAALQKVVAGQAVAYAETQIGTMDRLQIKMADINESIGDHLQKPMAQTSTIALDVFVPAIEQAADALGTLLDTFTLQADAGDVTAIFSMIPKVIRDVFPGQLQDALNWSVAQVKADEAGHKITVQIDKIQALINEAFMQGQPQLTEAGYEDAMAFVNGFKSTLAAAKQHLREVSARDRPRPGRCAEGQQGRRQGSDGHGHVGHQAPDGADARAGAHRGRADDARVQARAGLEHRRGQHRYRPADGDPARSMDEHHRQGLRRGRQRGRCLDARLWQQRQPARL